MIKYLFLTFISSSISIFIIQIFKTSMFNRSWSYPLLLASFPLFYLFFALWINDKTVMKNELVAGFVFFVVAFIYVRYRKPWVNYLLAGGFILHAAYDITHDWFFINMGVPSGWPVFCGIVNLFIGFYLVFLIRRSHSPYNRF